MKKLILIVLFLTACATTRPIEPEPAIELQEATASQCIGECESNNNHCDRLAYFLDTLNEDDLYGWCVAEYHTCLTSCLDLFYDKKY